jgi:hypothetical protein
MVLAGMREVVFEDEFWVLSKESEDLILFNKIKKIEFKINSDCNFLVRCDATICSNRWLKEVNKKKKGKK